MFMMDDAKKYGLQPAIMLYNFYFWLAKNKANNKHYYDGKTWTYNSQRAFARLFPFWSRRNVRTILQKLIDQKVLMTGNYNAIPYDKTMWYALVDEAALKEFVEEGGRNCPGGGQNRPIEVTESTNRSDAIDQPIPDIKPDIKPDKKKEPPSKEVKNKYSEFVRMTEKEYKKLIDDYGEKIAKDFIERVNDWIAQIGPKKATKYKSHYHMIKNWMRRDGTQLKAKEKLCPECGKRYVGSLCRKCGWRG